MITPLKSMWMKWLGYTACLGDGNSQKSMSDILNGKYLKRQWHRWVDINLVDLKEIG
jgi:hypothetical protein